jgi:hypothetical protein
MGSPVSLKVVLLTLVIVVYGPPLVVERFTR